MRRRACGIIWGRDVTPSEQGQVSEQEGLAHMGGIAGFFGPPDSELLRRMTSALRHRGPDGESFIEREVASLGFCHLALGPADTGSEPASGAAGSLVLACDGKTYNSSVIGEYNSGSHVAAGADVVALMMLRAYEDVGLDCFDRFDGEWAIAIIDSRHAQPRVILARDHMGVKPMYWARAGNRWLFASEIRSLREDRALDTGPDHARIREYLRRGTHRHDGGTYFRGVHELAAGSYAVIDDHGIQQHAYWTPEHVETRGMEGTAQAALKSAIRARVDGLDSVGVAVEDTRAGAAVVDCLGHLRESDRMLAGVEVRSFRTASIGASDELSPSTESVAVLPDPKGFLDELEAFLMCHEGPVPRTVTYAQWCLMRAAGGQVRVMLTSQGSELCSTNPAGDEAGRMRDMVRGRRGVAAGRDAAGPRGSSWLRSARRRLTFRSRELPVGQLLKPGPPRTSVGAIGAEASRRSHHGAPASPGGDRRSAAVRHTDRSSMRFSVQARLPFLDREVVEACTSRSTDEHGTPPNGSHTGRVQSVARGTSLPEMQWLRGNRSLTQSVFRSPAFCNREYWDGLGLAEAFRAACHGELRESALFWRALNVEVWLRTAFESPAHGVPYERIGDEQAARLAGTSAAQDALEHFRANPRRHLFQTVKGGAIYLRAPLKARLIKAGDDLEGALRESLTELPPSVTLRPGDVLALSEKAVSISQNRSFPIDQIRPRQLARFLSGFVRRTPVGIGLGMPETMELAIREVGAPRILLSGFAAALTRPFGVKGTFYRVAGRQVAAIDGPTPHTLPPYNTHAKLAPAEPDRVAAELAVSLGAVAGGPVGVAIIDANDIGVQVLGASETADTELLISLLADNPLGQASQQTPFALIRKVSG